MPRKMRKEIIFEGQDTMTKFANFKSIAHNMKGYDGYFLLEHLINNAMCPDKIINNGSKIMYITVEKDLHIKVMDSLNFLLMK